MKGLLIEWFMYGLSTVNDLNNFVLCGWLDQSDVDAAVAKKAERDKVLNK